MFGKIVAVLLIIGLIALSAKLCIGFFKDIKLARERKNAKSIDKKESK